jgi:hypothetical protein
LPIEKLGSIASYTKRYIIKLTEKRSQHQGSPSHRKRISYIDFASLTGYAIDGTYIQDGLWLKKGKTFLISM